MKIAEVPNKCPYCNKPEYLYYEGKKNGKYKAWMFNYHLMKEHKLNVEQYIVKFLNVSKCGCGKPLKVCLYSSGIVLNKFCADGKKCSSHKAWNKGLTRESNASIERQARWMEQNNPRLGKTAWNKGLTKETSKSMLSVSLKNMFRYPTEETRKKMSISASKRKVHGMLGKRHSQRLKNFMRDVTIERLKRDSNNGKSSSIELIFKKFLKRHNVKFVHQKKLGRYLYDFLIFIGDKKIVVECHGIYWHWHPRFFGHKKSIPIAVQKNLIRDKSKAKFINRSKKVDGMVVMWEHQIKCEKSIWITFKSKIRALFQSKNWELEAFMI